MTAAADPQSDISVASEVGRLRRVLIHEPGCEIDHMVPVMMEELLFDDILFGDAAREEHRKFRAVLDQLGVETLETADLLRETVEVDAARDLVLAALGQVVSRRTRERLEAAGAGELVRALIEGVRVDEERSGVEVEDLFEVPPIPNWCFQRDPQVVIQNHVLISAMAAPARWREALLARTIFEHHPSLAASAVPIDLFDAGGGRRMNLGPTRPSFEGGDVLILSKDVVAVGHSERTNRSGIRRLAAALADLSDGPRWLVVVKLPVRRAYMHLDTVFTQVDRDACLVYPPIIRAGGAEAADVYEIDLHSEERRGVACKGLFEALAARGVDMKPLACGGDDAINQQREQWTDGSNAVAVAPGVIILFDRNVKTADELDREGFDVITADDLLNGRAEVDADSGKRTCVLIASNEMSRARGGPHCLTHPLVRDAI